MGRSTVVVLLVPLLMMGGSPEATAQDAPTRPPVLVVEDLLGEDWKAARAARDELARLGARAVPALLEARRTSPAQARGPIDVALADIVRVLAEEVGRPLLAPAERITADGALGGILGASDRERPDTKIPTLKPEDLGDLGAIGAEEPTDWFGKRMRARRARGALALLGPPVSGALTDVPPLREAVHARLLGLVVGHIYAEERKRIAALPKDEGARAAFRARYRGVADLAAPILAAGTRDEDPTVRRLFQQIRDEVLERSLAGLDDASPSVRAAAEAALFRLGQLARQPLIRIANGDNPAFTGQHVRETAARLARRIRFGATRELIRRIGHDFDGYDALPFRERRALVFELERLGGDEAIPALRALLREEASDEVRSVAAIGLFRQGDPAGAEWIALNRAGVQLVRISKRELAAIYMDQGLRYLTLGRFERAEREFKQVLEVEPENDVAWYNLACTYSRWGKVDEAIEHLEKAVQFGFDDTSHMAQDPDLETIRDDPRYKAIIAAIEGEAPEEPEETPEDEAPEDEGGTPGEEDER